VTERKCSERRASGAPWWLLTAACVLLPACVGARTPTDVLRSQSRFVSAATGYRQDLLQRTGLEPRTREAVEGAQFVYERSQIPSVRTVRRFGERRIVISDGWMAITEEMVRASVIARHRGAPGCFRAYATNIIKEARKNRVLLENARPEELSVLQSFSDFVESPDGEDYCAGLNPWDWKSPGVEEDVAAGIDAALIWLVGRQLALLVDPADDLAFHCPEDWADRVSREWAAALQIDLLPAHAAVLTQVLLSASAPSSAPLMPQCRTPKRRLEGFFEGLAATRAGPTGDADLQSARNLDWGAWVE